MFIQFYVRLGAHWPKQVSNIANLIKFYKASDWLNLELYCQRRNFARNEDTETGKS